MMRRVTLLVTVDTEEDNWAPARRGITVENVRELPRLDAFLTRLGVRATYLTTYQVARHRWAADLLAGLARDGHCEVAAHLHPWNTPPTTEAAIPRNTMAKNLPFELQLAKLRRLTRRLENALGHPPVSFRAGRYGLGPSTIRALIACGYRVDTSVAPFTDWRATDEGADYRGAPIHPYRLDGSGDVRMPVATGPLLEIPLSVGFNHGPLRAWRAVHTVLASPTLRALKVQAFAARSGFSRRLFLSPEVSSARDMLRLSRLLLSEGASHLNLFFHSTSLRPGMSPFVGDRADVERLFARMEDYLEGLAGIASIGTAVAGDYGRSDATPDPGDRRPSRSMDEPAAHSSA